MLSALIDTGIWYALFDRRDAYYDPDEADALAQMIEPMAILVPWPVTYETIRTRFAKNWLALQGFERQLKSSRTVFVDDAPYRADALEICLERSIKERRPYSLVDCLLREVLMDRNMRVDYMITNNVRDFADVGAQRSVELVSLNI